MPHKDALAIAILDAFGLDHDRVCALDLRFRAGEIPTMRVEYLRVGMMGTDTLEISNASKIYELRLIEAQEENDA